MFSGEGLSAQIAGERAGRVLESEGDVGQSFRNTYEQTKLEAETFVDACDGSWSRRPLPAAARR